MDTPTKNRRLLLGARAIARYALVITDDPRRFTKRLPTSKLPISKLNGRLAAYSDSLDTAMLAKEEEALRSCERRRLLLREASAAKTHKAQVLPKSRRVTSDLPRLQCHVSGKYRLGKNFTTEDFIRDPRFQTHHARSRPRIAARRNRPPDRMLSTNCWRRWVGHKRRYAPTMRNSMRQFCRFITEPSRNFSSTPWPSLAAPSG